MGSLHLGDDNLHHCDSSHRWIAPPDIDQHLWLAVVRDHMEEHRKTMGGPAVPEGRAGCTPFAPERPTRAYRRASPTLRPVGTRVRGR